ESDKRLRSLICCEFDCDLFEERRVFPSIELKFAGGGAITIPVTDEAALVVKGVPKNLHSAVWTVGNHKPLTTLLITVKAAEHIIEFILYHGSGFFGALPVFYSVEMIVYLNPVNRSRS